ncbi:tryptophanyl-tRNA synthetase [Angomonas deanei]|uniref:tryptophan--tRNA ligase n=1 Tax=Angomonas deanei TaxID=59799 RepID=S9U6G3_9TRYP|nr:tryptophanyl-tRNA synthetase [Angomonas deanei]EPY24513.1 tryptophanyl-tRNA synthetase [Angomonas deanei]CAD2219138.1 tRNA synthetases class I (W and Y), putative [Angomonas deanei]|eukprot:EPY24279.1 tryptophanyl-tRNA synthetase [Angomonas deanei]
MRRIPVSAGALQWVRYNSNTAQTGDEDVITPWSVAAKGPKGINYDRVLTTFKAEPVDESVVAKLRQVLEKQHGKEKPPPLHHFFTRGVVFSHRDFIKALDDIEENMVPGKHKAFLYTGRGPSSGSMHVGHVIPFLLTKYLQDTFSLPLVIQITDDEKFLFRDVPFEGPKADELITSNIKDIIAFGFNPRRTFIFRNSQYMGEMYPTVLSVQKLLTGNAVKNTFGIADTDSVGKFAFPATQAAPSFSSSFRRVLHSAKDEKLRCIIPCAIDQDPFFVLTRNVAPRIKAIPPALLHTKFLPALKGLEHKMSSSAEQNGVITLHDTDQQVKKKLRKAFSGGRATIEEMREKGADLETDVAYQFIKFFSPDDALLEKVTKEYQSGDMNSGTVKDIAAEVVVEHVMKDWRERRLKVTDEDVQHFTGIRNILL